MTEIVVTQADRDAAADLLDEISNLLDHNGIGQVADLIRDGDYDEHEATLAFALHRLQSTEQRLGQDADALTSLQAEIDVAKLHAEYLITSHARTVAELQAERDRLREALEDCIPVLVDMLSNECVEEDECVAIGSYPLCGWSACQSAGCIVDKLKRARAALDPIKDDNMGGGE